MPRSIWNGAITIYATSIPVKLFAATSEQTARFRELHAKDGAPIEHRKVSSKTGREVPKERIVKGYETSPGRHVVLAPEEIRAVEQPERKEIAIEHFVPAEQIDPVFFDRAYHLGAQDEGRDAFAALLRALERTDLVGIGRVVLRAKEQLVALRPGDGVFRLSTMRFADEIVGVKDLDVTLPQRKPSKREVEMAEKLVDGLAQSFDPSAFRDSFKRRVDAYAKKKAKGKAPELPSVEEPEAPDDLLEALEASLNGGS
ncbi:MAG TPA: Ku protein [Solirubrobacteraceae bacterium]